MDGMGFELCITKQWLKEAQAHKTPGGAPTTVLENPVLITCIETGESVRYINGRVADTALGFDIRTVSRAVLDKRTMVTEDGKHYTAQYVLPQGNKVRRNQKFMKATNLITGQVIVRESMAKLAIALQCGVRKVSQCIDGILCVSETQWQIVVITEAEYDTLLSLEHQYKEE